MLKQLLGKLITRPPRHWTETEIRDLIAAGDFDKARNASEALHPDTPDIKQVQMCLKAEIAFRTHDDASAEAFYSQVLKQAPGFSDAHHGLSLLMHSRGEYESAFQHALFASNAAPTESRYLAQLGLCHICLGNFAQAEESLQRALRQAPNDKASWNNLGIALLSKGRNTEARACFINALKLDPEFNQALQNLAQLNTDTAPSVQAGDPSLTDPGDALEDRTSPKGLAIDPTQPPQPWHDEWRRIASVPWGPGSDEVISATETLLLNHADDAELAVLANRLYRRRGDADSGLAVLHAFLIHHPDSAVAHEGMGNALLERPDYPGAERHLKRALELGSRHQDVLQALRSALMKQGRFAEALPIAQECQARWPSDINLALLALAYNHNCDYAEAITCFDELEAKDLVSRLGVKSAYALCLSYTGRVKEALAIFDEQIGLLGNTGQLRLAKAAMHLLTEDFGAGWDGYRHRQLGLSNYRVLPVPEWQGEDLKGKTIVVLAEQGLGDQVMFASCLPDLLARKPARVVLEAISRVAPTLARSFPECEVIGSRQDSKLEWLRDIENVDCFVPLGDLPRHFRRTIDSFPRQPYLKPDSARVRHWRSRLERLGAGPYFGTSWRGGTEPTRSAIRTLSPSLLKPLTCALPSQWVSLQYGDVREELALAQQAGITLTHWSSAIADLDEFAALIAALDGVFTVCNTTVHYAGAVGQKTWVLAPTVPEWRYGLTNRNMPWYPHVQVLRQPKPHDWETLVAQAALCLVDEYRPLLVT
ncbi:tetratricopeptide repeat protein [Hydrogenophaga atypica]|uniref:Tetratricopeptide repeat protein n=1 Tax=Hydrogenophaga atypica TaxID=249409 RepID=A0ABW2QEG0_9BURK